MGGAFVGANANGFLGSDGTLPFEFYNGGNLYHFVHGNPVQSIDPFGLDIFVVRELCGKFGHERVIGDNGDGTYWETDKMPGDHWYPCPPNIGFEPNWSANDPRNPDSCTKVMRTIKTTPEVDRKTREEVERRYKNRNNETPYGFCSHNCRDYTKEIADFADPPPPQPPLFPGRFGGY